MRKMYADVFAIRNCLPIALFILLASVFSQHATAQSAANFTVARGTNASLLLDMNSNAVDMSSGTTQLIGPSIDDGSSAVTNLPFEFPFMGTVYTQFSVSSNGFLRFGATAIGTTQRDFAAGNDLVVPFGEDHATHATGKVHMKVVGTAPNRTLVIEFQNMSVDFESTVVDANFQLRLYEGTGVMEFVYGAMAVGNELNILTPPGARIGFSKGAVSATNTFTIVTPATYQNPAVFTAANVNNYPVGVITDLNSATDGNRIYYRLTPNDPPASPTGLNFTSVTGIAMTLNWTDATNELGYAIYRSTDGGATYTYLTTVAANTVSYAATGLLPGTSYTWKVVSYKEAFGTPLTGTQATSPAGTVTSVATGNWSNTATWSTGAVPTASDNVIIADGHTVTIDVAANAYTLTIGQGVSGILQYEAATARTLTVGSNVTVAAGGIFQSAATGTVTTHGLSIGGNLTNNGTIDFSTGATQTAGAQITFTGTNAATWTSGATSVTDLRQTTGVTLNKGNSIASTLTFEPSAGTFMVQQANTAGFLAITNGLFILGGTNTFSNPLFASATYTIPAAGGLWLNNSNSTIVAQTGTATMNGLFRISSGVYNVGTAADNSLGFGSGSTITVEGGVINAAGRFGVAAAANTITYNQSGGTITVQMVGNTSTTLAGFDAGTSATTNFTMSSGSINVVLASTAASGPRDYRGPSAAATLNLANGTVNLGTAGSGATKTYFIQGSVPYLVVTNTSANHNASLAGATNIVKDFVLNGTGTLNLNGFVLTLRGAYANATGVLTANATGSGIVFAGTTPQTLAGTITANQISNLTVNNATGVVITPSVQVNTSLTLTAGDLSSGGTLTIGSGGTNSFTYIRTNGNTTGTVIYNYGTGTNNFTYNGTLATQTTGAELPATVATGTLTINNTNGVTLNSPLSIQNLTLTAGKLVTTNTNLLTVTATTAASVSGGSATSYVDGPLARTLPASLASGSTYRWPVGKSAYQLFELINPTTDAAGTVVVKVESFDTDPGGTYTGFAALTNNRYWQVSLSGAGTLSSAGQVRLTETGLTGSTKIGQSVNATPSGTYTNVGGLVLGSTISSSSALAAFGTGANSTYFITGTATSFAAGKYSIGPSGSYTAPEAPAYAGTFTTLTAALAAIGSAGTPTGNVIFELQNNYDPNAETFPIVSTFQGSAAATLTIRPRSDVGGVVHVITSGTAQTIDLNTADYVIIDGRPGAGLGGNTKAIQVINTSATGVAVRMINDATNNTLNYLDLQGQNTATTSAGGVVNISTGVTTGNDNNTISNSDIHGTSGGNPTIGIISTGSTTNPGIYNDNGSISTNNIYDVFSAGSATTAIKLDVGNNAWTVSANNIYQTASRTYTTGNTHRGIWITPNTASISNTASGFVVTGNYIGGTDVQAGGSAMSLTGANITAFWGMDISVGFGAATSIQNNRINNIILTTTSGSFFGISQNTGNVNIGTITGNYIGDSTINGGITVTTTATGGGTAFGIRTIGGTGATVNVQNNTIAGISTTGTATLGVNITGISIEGSTAAIINVSNNRIGNGDITNSLNASQATTGNTQSVRGIAISNTGAGTVTVANNIIINLNNNYTGTGAGVAGGIMVTTSSANPVLSITGNAVRNLTNSSATTGTGAGSAIVGISAQNTNAAGMTISRNLVDSLVLTNTSSATAAINAIGMFVSAGTGTPSMVNRNFVHSIDYLGTSINTILTGVDIAAGNVDFINNMVRLGIKPDGTDLMTESTVRGISSNSSNTVNAWFNSIYIGGQNVAATSKNSFAFNKTAASGTYDIRNNIFSNVRSSSGTGSKHYGLYLTSATTTTVNYNLYDITGNEGVFAFNGSTNVTSYTSGWISSDNNSVTGDPKFVNPTGDIANVNLHLQTGSPAESNGVAIGTVTDDYDGQVRSTLSPTDIGADAGNFAYTGIDLGISAFVSPAASGCYTATQTITVTLKNYSANPIDFSTANANVTVTGSGPGGYTYNDSKLITSGILNSGATMDVVMTATANMGVRGTYTFNSNVAITTVGQTDVNPANNAVSPISRLIMDGAYNVGAGGDYATITAAVSDYSVANCISSNLTFNLTDATYDGTTETLPIVISQSANAGTKTLTIKPASGNTATITGAVTAGALIRINGADYVIIDGSNNGTNTQDLTISNTHATTPSGIAIISGGTGAGATNNTIKNVIITTTTNQSNYAISIGGSAPGTAGADNDDITIQNNTITNTANGIYAIGTAAGLLNNLTVSGNTITTLSDESSMIGIRVGQATNAMVSGNSISMETTGTTPVGISLESGVVSSSVTSNVITKILSTNAGGYGGRGITIGTENANSDITVANNMISGVNGSNWTAFGNSSAMGISVGIIGNSGTLTTITGGIKLYHNSINLSGNYSGTSTTANKITAALYVGSGASALDIRNNIFINSLHNASAVAKNYAIFSVAASSAYTQLNNNNYYVSGVQGVLGNIGAADVTTLAALQTAFGQNANSVNMEVYFVSANDLHIIPASNAPFDNLGVGIAAITTDIDAQVRNASTPDIGADEFTPPACTGAVGGDISAPTITYCGPGTPAITATGFSQGSGSTYQWQQSSDNFAANVVDIAGQTIPVSLTLPAAVTTTTYYRLKVTCTSGTATAYSDTLTITINPKPTVSITPSGSTTVCAGSSITLNASGTSDTYSWAPAATLNQSTGASVIATPTVSTTYTVTGTITATGCTETANILISVPLDYTVTATATPGAVCSGGTVSLSAVTSGTASGTVGTQTTTIGGNDGNPYRSGNGTGNQIKTQMLVRASELSAAGIPAGPINSLGFTTTTSTGTVVNFTIRMANTAATALTTTYATPTWTSVFSQATFTPVPNTTNVHVFSTPFIWDGVSNVLVETCQTNSVTGTSTVAAHNPGFAANTHSASSTTACSNATGTAVVNRPIMTFGYPQSYNWTWSDGTSTVASSASASVNPVNATSAPITVTYTATATNAATGCSRSHSAVVTVDPATVGGTTASDQSICIGNTPANISLTGNVGSVVKWQRSTDPTFATGTTDIASTSTTLTGAVIGQLTQTTYFRAVVKSGACAEANSASVTVTVTSNITASTALAASGACANYNVAASNNYMSNCDLIATIVPNGASPVTGNINACVTIDGSVQSAPNGVPYVQRHYNILPATNATTATSRITLYFLQAEFDAFNTASAAVGMSQLPANSGDAAGKANLRVTQFNTAAAGTPGTYPDGTGSITNPADIDISFADGRWSVTFDATGSGAFYVHTGQFVLPVSLLDFKGEQAGNINKLSWKTATEINNRGFELERSADGKNFSTLGFTGSKAENGNSTSALNYSYNDNAPLQGNNYYRLKQIDRDGKFAYSNIILLSRKVADITLTSVYPNPTDRLLNLVITAPKAEKITIVVTDLTGKVLLQQSTQLVMGENQQKMDLMHLAAGTYFIKTVCANGCETAVHKFIKY